MSFEDEITDKYHSKSQVRICLELILEISGGESHRKLTMSTATLWGLYHETTFKRNIAF